MNQFKTIRLSWDEVSHLISREIKTALGKTIRCNACPDAYDYWCAGFPNYRMPLSEIHMLVGALKLTKEESFDCFPNEEDGTTDIGSIGMKASEALLRRAMPFKWTHYLFDNDYIWIITNEQTDKSESKPEKKNEFDFGGDDSIIGIGPKTVNISRLGFFDELEYDAWRLIEAHAAQFGIKLIPKYPLEWNDDEECIDFYASKRVVETILALFIEAGVKFITEEQNEGSTNK